jgi:leucyl-tRNA synthetase
MELAADMDKSAIEQTVLANEQTIKHLQGKDVKKVIVVPGKIVNLVF